MTKLYVHKQTPEQKIIQMEAEYINPSGTIPALAKDSIVSIQDNHLSIQTKGGVLSAELGTAYVVKNPLQKDGSEAIDIIKLQEPTAQQYIVCTADGQDILPLPEYHETAMQLETKNARMEELLGKDMFDVIMNVNNPLHSEYQQLNKEIKILAEKLNPAASRGIGDRIV